uniref:Uncharacterized protein n=1 Tax=Setaria viridis TaxID=4556 RepID=A0A4U6UK98_SETVI|nr:hypothetical protein SEVIR_5G320700v2 [Setaria viridis]
MLAWCARARSCDGAGRRSGSRQALSSRGAERRTNCCLCRRGRGRMVASTLWRGVDTDSGDSEREQARQAGNNEAR